MWTLEERCEVGLHSVLFSAPRSSLLCFRNSNFLQSTGIVNLLSLHFTRLRFAVV